MPTLRDTVPLQKVKITKKSIEGIIKLIFICGFLSIFVCVFTLAEAKGLPDVLQVARKCLLVAWFLLVLFLLMWNPIYQYFYFKRYFYDMDEKNIIIRKGVFAQKEITLPFSFCNLLVSRQNITR